MLLDTNNEMVNDYLFVPLIVLVVFNWWAL